VPESIEQRIAQLMAEGLDHYGQDRVERAVTCWREVLALNPRHQVARDYLEAAGYASEGSGPAATPGGVAGALALFRSGRTVDALELLESTASPDDLDAQATLDLLRSRLYDQYRAETGEGEGVPGVVLGPDAILGFNLPANAGFLLSMVDGNTSVDDLVTLSGMDPFEAMHVLHRLVRAGIVEVGT
jgi:hypothetical protein